MIDEGLKVVNARSFRLKIIRELRNLSRTRYRRRRRIIFARRSKSGSRIILKFHLHTHLASRARANTPAASGAAADVPLCVVVHLPQRSVVAWKKKKEKKKKKERRKESSVENAMSRRISSPAVKIKIYFNRGLLPSIYLHFNDTTERFNCD